MTYEDELWAAKGALQAIAREQAPQSAAQAKRAAKEALAKMRSESRNTLHLYCKWMNHPVNKNLARMLFYLQKPERFGIRCFSCGGADSRPRKEKWVLGQFCVM